MCNEAEELRSRSLPGDQGTLVAQNKLKRDEKQMKHMKKRLTSVFLYTEMASSRGGRLCLCAWDWPGRGFAVAPKKALE